MVSRRLRDDTSDLVLDGRLMGEAREELNIQELLKHAVATFDGGGTVPEASLVARWPVLREELRAAQRAWDAGTIGTTARPTTAASFRFPAEAGPDLDLLGLAAGLEHDGLAVALAHRLERHVHDVVEQERRVRSSRPKPSSRHALPLDDGDGDGEGDGQE